MKNSNLLKSFCVIVLGLGLILPNKVSAIDPAVYYIGFHQATVFKWLTSGGINVSTEPGVNIGIFETMQCCMDASPNEACNFAAEDSGCGQFAVRSPRDECVGL